MLADSTTSFQSGRLDPGVQPRFAGKIAIIEFIVKELPQWRDYPHRPNEYAETKLTEHLCDYLNSVARCSPIWSQIQFRTETSDEVNANRNIDLTVKPCIETLIIEGRRHTLFDALFPIECKRLPTPRGGKRDQREYVTSRFSTTGGIERFKFGHHGANHSFAAMIAYVQDQSCSYWLGKVNGWISELSSEQNSIWDISDQLQQLSDDLKIRVSTFKSEHQRRQISDKIELRHLWIEMS